MALTDPGHPSALDLRAIDSDALDAARSLAALLDGSSVGDGSTLAARVVARPDVRGCWLASSDARLAVRAIDGEAIVLHPERVERIVAALDRLDAAFDAIEAASGLLVEFTACIDAPAEAPVVELRLEDAARNQSALFFLLPRSDWRAPPQGKIVRTGSAVVLVSRTVRAARLSINDAGDLGVGDVLMLREGPWAMDAAAATGSWSGTFDSATGQFFVEQLPADRKDRDVSTSPDADEASTRDRIGGFTVPIGMTLPDTSATVDELAALTGGSTLVLGPVAAGLDVELRIADRRIAGGELVRLGDNYAVLITDVPTPPRPASTAPPAA